MKSLKPTTELRGYCAQCSCYCRIISCIEDGRFTAVKADKEHPLATPICVKGLAGPELVYSKQRLQYPVRRTRPKGDPDPGWERITWDEALNTIAARLNKIKAEFGPEAVATTRAGPGGSALSEVWPWLRRFAYAFGTPNNISTTHICQWHRDNCSSFTYGMPISRDTAGKAEFERAGCILIWGVNLHATRPSLLPLIRHGLNQGAKLIVIDPRQIELTDMADLWLQVKPGTDGALAMGMLNIMIEENRYDHDFTADWTTAPFLVRSDTGNLLRASDLTSEADPTGYVLVNSADNQPEIYTPGTVPSSAPVMDTTCQVSLASGEKVACKTVFRLLRELASEYPPGRVETLTGVPEDKIREAVRLFTGHKPACWYAWNGIEQNLNASQTNRALCILYALTGDFDKPGGNVKPPAPPVNSILGLEFLNPETRNKRLGYAERPLGPTEVQAYEVYQAIFTGKPYPIKALLGFGGNWITSNAPALVAREALSKLDLYVQTELFLSPSAELADIVLPAASSWECWHIGINVSSVDAKAYIQLRPAVVPPQHDSWPDVKILFELATRMGLGDKFWGGDAEAAFDYLLAPLGITVQQLRNRPGGVTIDLPMEYLKHRQQDGDGNSRGFPTPSKRVELYSQIFKDHGYDPLPTWQDPSASLLLSTSSREKYSSLITGAKVVEFCHSQHRALPSLRKRVPHPFLEINPRQAGELGCKDGDWLVVKTPHRSITLRAKLTEGIAYGVVCTQNGWWQACPELNLPGYDPYSSAGANVNLLYNTEYKDVISGSLPIKGYPCNVKKR